MTTTDLAILAGAVDSGLYSVARPYPQPNLDTSVLAWADAMEEAGDERGAIVRMLHQTGRHPLETASFHWYVPEPEREIVGSRSEAYLTLAEKILRGERK